MTHTNLSKFLSLVLRHKPHVINIKLDQNGYADTNELLNKMNKAGKYINIDILKDIVETDNKGRYSFNEDCSKIRANQGHSIKVDVELENRKPPHVLYHSTATRFLENILSIGLDKRNRLYVHLSDSPDTMVGSRHGIPILLEIDSDKMYKDGYKFYLSANNVWLTECVPTDYIRVVK